MRSILVTGSSGQLGQELQELSSRYPQFRFHFYNRTELDISDAAAVSRLLEATKPDYCINCAAYTAVDKAESEPESAYAINAAGPSHLAAACKSTGTRFLHVSTDYVFSGSGTDPYGEEDPTGPLGTYGATKLQGEVLAMEANPESVIIRTAWVYSRYGNNFVKTMMRLMSTRPAVSVVSDQWGTPTWAADLASAIMTIIESDRWVPGIYHYSHDGRINWFDFAEAIREWSGFDCTVQPITTEQYPTPAPRPKNSLLRKDKISATYGLTIYPWKERLQACLAQMKPEG